VAQSPGERLEPELQARIAPLVGHELGGVRVHTDPGAAQSARALGARAYTAGSHVVFGPGQYRPETPAGRALVAHELAHVAQQAKTGAALQRQPDWQNDPDVVAAPGPPDPAVDLVGALRHAIELPLLNIALKSEDAPPTIVVKQQWPAIRRWILNAGKKPRGKRKAPKPPQDFEALAAEDIVAALTARTDDERQQAADALLDELVKEVGSAAPDVLRQEFALIDPAVRKLIEPDAEPFVGYVAMREGIRKKFGSIKAFNAYYKTLVAADFPQGSSILGTQSKVNPRLKTALEKAETLLKSKAGPGGQGTMLDAVTKHLTGIETIAGKQHRRGYWATNVRENRNRQKEASGDANLSEHSFGFAMDVNADWNPNLPKFPWHHVERLTGVDVYGPERTKAQPGESYDTVLAAAQKFKAASDKFRDIFDSEANLQAAMADQAKKEGALVPAGDLFKAVAAAATEKPGRRGARPNLSALQGMLEKAIQEEAERKQRDADKPDPDAPPVSIQSIAHEDPLAVAVMVGKLRSKVGGRADLDRLMPLVEAQLKDPADKAPRDTPKALQFMYQRKFVAELRKIAPVIRTFEMPNSLRRYLEPAARAADAATLAKYLIELHQVFQRTRIAAGPHVGEKIDISSRGNLPQVAAHGFMDLMPELVAALTSKDGGGLLWLGTVGKGRGGKPLTKDWMHFELPKQEEPAISFEGPWETDQPATP
jgi:hypothetical protein